MFTFSNVTISHHKEETYVWKVLFLFFFMFKVHASSSSPLQILMRPLLLKMKKLLNVLLEERKVLEIYVLKV
jgi:hypothetical protein